MEDDKKHYRFVNGKTGYVIAYLSIPLDAPEEHEILLENRKKELAVEHAVFVDTIYWEHDKQR